MIEYGVLPEPTASTDEIDKYSFKWEDLYAPSEKEKAEIGKTRAEALASYTKNQLTSMILPPEAFLETCLGMDQDTIDQIIEMVGRSINEEVDEFKEEQRVAMEEARRNNPPNNDGENEDE
jgi:hypothetical protein